MKTKVEVRVHNGKVSLVLNEEIIAANFGSCYPPIPTSFINDGWLNGFPKEAEVQYKKKRLGAIEYLYLVTQDNGEVLVG